MARPSRQGECLDIARLRTSRAGRCLYGLRLANAPVGGGIPGPCPSAALRATSRRAVSRPVPAAGPYDCIVGKTGRRQDRAEAPRANRGRPGWTAASVGRQRHPGPQFKNAGPTRTGHGTETRSRGARTGRDATSYPTTMIRVAPTAPARRASPPGVTRAGVPAAHHGWPDRGRRRRHLATSSSSDLSRGRPWDRLHPAASAHRPPATAQVPHVPPRVR